MSKQKKGRAGLLAAEEWLECGHVYPRKAGRTGLLGAVVCMDRTVPRCGCWARLLRGAPEDRLGLLGDSGWGEGPLLMQGTGLVSLPWSWEGCERRETGD